MARSKKAGGLRLSASWTFETNAEGNRTLKVCAIDNGDAPSVVGELTLNMSNPKIASAFASGLSDAMLEADHGIDARSLRNDVIALLKQRAVRAPVLKLVSRPPRATRALSQSNS